MGKAKSNEPKVYNLTEQELNHVKILQTALAFHTLKDKIIVGFLYSVAQGRLGISTKNDLQFELNLDEDSPVLKISELPTEV